MAAATAKKATPARKRSTSSKKSAAVNAPKLTKTQKETVEQAVRLGLDVDPLNFDLAALKAAVKVATKFLAFDEATAVEIVGTDGRVFDNGHMLKSTASTLRMRNALGTVEVPVELIGDVRPIQGEVKPIGAETARARRAGPVNAKTSSSTASETRPPREGSGLWAALEVLKKARTPMTGADVFAKIKERKLAPGLKGKTPEATITAALNVAAARQQHGVVRPEPGRFAIKKGGN